MAATVAAPVSTAPTQKPSTGSRKAGLKSGTSAGGDSSDNVRMEAELETILTQQDLNEICDALQAEGNGYDNRLSLDKSQLREFLSIVIRKGNEDQFNDFFDKVDSTKMGKIDWHRIADHFYSEFEGKDDKNKQTTVPNWRPRRELQQNPHRDQIQRIIFWEKLKKYITISKEGVIALWNDHNCELNASKKLVPDGIKQRDLWVTDAVLLAGLGKLGVSNTCKEICIYELNTKMEFPCLYRIHNFKSTPYSLHFWPNPMNVNVSILSVGDTKGKVLALNFEQSTITLFDRPPKPAGEEKEQTLQIDIQELEAVEPPLEKERETRTCWLSYHHWHQPEHIRNYLLDEVRLLNQRSSKTSVPNPPPVGGTEVSGPPIRKLAVSQPPNSGTSRRSGQGNKPDVEDLGIGAKKQIMEFDIWVRQVRYIAQLDCIISCTTTTESSMVLAWRKPGMMKYSQPLKLEGGVHAFDFNEETNIIGIACADRNVYLYNPFVMSKPAGKLPREVLQRDVKYAKLRRDDQPDRPVSILVVEFFGFPHRKVLRGHMSAVVQVQFNQKRNHIISYSKDRVLRVWDVAQQISLQRIAGINTTGGVDQSAFLFYHSDRTRLLIAMDASLSVMALKPEVKNRITSHEQPVTCARFLDQNQVISSDLGGTVYIWRIDTGQRSKKFATLHEGMDISCLALNEESTRFFTGSSDGTVREWDVAGNSRKTFIVDTGGPDGSSGKGGLEPVFSAGATASGTATGGSALATGGRSGGSFISKRKATGVSSGMGAGGARSTSMNSKHGRPAEVLNVVLLKREIVAVGWERTVCMFIPGEVEDGSNGYRSPWKGGVMHCEDVVTAAFAPPITLATGSLDGEIVVWNMNSQSPSKSLTARKRQPVSLLHTAQTMGTSALAHIHEENLTSRPESKFSLHSMSPSGGRESKLSGSSNRNDSLKPEEEHDDYAVSTLLFIKSRMDNKKAVASGLANLISCGAGGWVRFWNTITGNLCAEFCAHPGVTTVIMRLDAEDSTTLITGDTDGYLKVWDIEDYCCDISSTLLQDEPECMGQWQAQEDAISSLDIMHYKSEDVWLVLSSSHDLTINLWMLDGTHIGTFGQDLPWKIKKPSPLDFNQDNQEGNELASDDEGRSQLGDLATEANELGESLGESFSLSRLSDSQIVDLLRKYIKVVDQSDLANERFDVWKTSKLGTRYSEDRTSKRERRQPKFQRDFPYLYAEAMGKPAFGPHYSLETAELKDTVSIAPEKPKSITDDSLMRSANSAAENANRRELDISAPPKFMFEEKNFFPKSILQKEHERNLAKMQDARRGTLFSLSQRTGAGVPPGVLLLTNKFH